MIDRVGWFVSGVLILAAPSLDRPSAGITRDPVQTCDRLTAAENGSARFVVAGDGSRETHSLTADANLILCSNTSETMLWVRLALSKANGGDDGPHLDIDICNARAGGTFRPMEARAQPCPGGTTWGLWWHADGGAVYANTATSPECALTLEWSGPDLAGSFSCRGLLEADGPASVDVLEGSFSCTIGQSEPPPASERSPPAGADLRAAYAAASARG